MADRSFVQVPQAVLLHYFVSQRRLYFPPCRIPEDEDYELIRVANRHPNLCLRDITLVAQWKSQARILISPKSRWHKLLERARDHQAQKRAELDSQTQQPWHFFCGPTQWRVYEVTPITDHLRLWGEGSLLGNCLYKLAFECTALEPSRFSSLQKAGKGIATLDLSWRIPQAGDQWMGRTLGRWELQDLRLAYNRTPDEELVETMRAFAWMYNA